MIITSFKDKFFAIIRGINHNGEQPPFAVVMKFVYHFMFLYAIFLALLRIPHFGDSGLGRQARPLLLPSAIMFHDTHQHVP